MQVVFMVAKVGDNGSLQILPTQHDTYPAAEASIAELPAGTYQVQKFFVKA